MAESDRATATVPARSWTYGDTARATLTVVGVALAYAILYSLRGVVFYLFVAVILATALEPVIASLERFRMSRPLATGTVYVLLTFGLGTLAVYGLPLLIDQARSLVDTVPTAYERLRSQLAASSNEVLGRVGSSLPEKLGNLTPGEMGSGAGLNLERVAEAVSWTEPVLHGLFVFASIMVLALFWSLHGQRTVRSLLLWLSPKRREPAREFFEAAQAKVGAYLRGQGILCVTVGSMTLVALLIIGLPNALALAMLAGVLEAVPVLGPTLGAIPAILVAASVDASRVVWVIAAAVVIQQTENYVLAPRVMDRSVGVNPLVTLMALAAFSALLGLPGLVLAIPMAAIIQLILERLVLDTDATPPAAPSGRGTVSLLRYRVHELMQDIRRIVREKDETLAHESDRVEEAVENIAQELDEKLSVEEQSLPSQPPEPPSSSDAANGKEPS